jgi:CheY-like chemotaxis protein
VAQILISEPSIDVRALLTLLAQRLGHEVVYAAAAGSAALDAAIVEPADPLSLGVARALRCDRPDLPIVFVSVEPPRAETIALEPVRHVIKPFARADIAAALDDALRAHRPAG